MKDENLEVKQFLRKNLYRHYRVHRMTVKAVNIIAALFNAFISDTRLLPPDTAAKAKSMEAHSGMPGRARAVADYIAGMTDRFAIAEYQRLIDPAELT